MRIMQGRNRIRDLRVAAGLTGQQLAAALGVDAATVSRWENEVTGVPDKHKLTLAERFGVSVSHLMGWADGDNGDGNGQRIEAA